MSSGRTILLTGGTGFLGSKLLTKLANDGQNVILLKRSTSDIGRIRGILSSIRHYDIDDVQLDHIFAENRIDLIIHCATNQGKKQANPTSIIDTNVRFPLVLLQLAVEHAVPCFINTDTTLDRRVNAYALSKHQFREWLYLFSDRITCVNVALELVYGPGETGSNFIGSVVRDLLMNVASLDFTHGEQKRDFSYIDDVINAYMKIIDHSRVLGKGFYPFDAGSGQVVTVREFVLLAKLLTENTRTNLNFGALPYRKHEFMDSCVDLSSLRALGWDPQWSLGDGLRSTIAAEKDRMSSKK